MTRRTMTGYDGVKYKAWECRDRHLGRKGNGCRMRTIRETELLEQVAEELGTTINENNAVKLDRVDVLMDGMEVHPGRARVSA